MSNEEYLQKLIEPSIDIIKREIECIISMAENMEDGNYTEYALECLADSLADKSTINQVIQIGQLRVHYTNMLKSKGLQYCERVMIQQFLTNLKEL